MTMPKRTLPRIADVTLGKEPFCLRVSLDKGDESTVVGSEAIDMAADTLWRLAQEQSGATMSADAFRSWRQKKAYTLDEAAKALGISRRMIAYYDQGDKPIPR